MSAKSPIHSSKQFFWTNYQQSDNSVGPGRTVRIADNPDTTGNNGLNERIALLSALEAFRHGAFSHLNPIPG